MSEERLSIAAAEALVSQALQRCRTASDTAETVARALVAAEADGLKGHGLSRVPSYAAQARIGKIDGFARASVETVTPALLRIDAGLGFAYPAIDLAITG
ncbi:MAG TPA: Ldh family oxidoreductase, partial [Beijerinckiaceae bacterium]|nr:Ldh family oxidoreductase [Beijerinckiaceae bacterium]